MALRKGTALALVGSVALTILASPVRHGRSFSPIELMQHFPQDGETESWPEENSLPGSSDGSTSWIAGAIMSSVVVGVVYYTHPVLARALAVICAEVYMSRPT